MRKRKRTSYRRQSIDKLQRGMKEKAAQEGRCQLPIADVAAVNNGLTIAYSVSNSSTSVYLPWKIIHRKVRREGKPRKASSVHSRNAGTSLTRFIDIECDVPESVVAKRDAGGTARLSPVAVPPCTVHVIIRCRRGPTNILITSQYINY